MPTGYRTGAEAVRGVGIELGLNSVFNLFREFSPELKRCAALEIDRAQGGQNP
jgi:hypothetical protein